MAEIVKTGQLSVQEWMDLALICFLILGAAWFFTATMFLWFTILHG